MQGIQGIQETVAIIFSGCEFRLAYKSELGYTAFYYSLGLWPFWLNGQVLVYELRGYGFESHCNRLNFRYWTYFEQGVP